MTKQGKIIITVSSLVLLGGISYLLYKHFGKPSEDKPAEDKPKEDKPIPEPIKPAISLVGKGVYANKDGVNVYSIYNSAILKTAKKGEWLGTLKGDHNKNAYYINTTFGPAFVTKALVNIK